jgi:hypothetical protein
LTIPTDTAVQNFYLEAYRCAFRRSPTNRDGPEVVIVPMPERGNKQIMREGRGAAAYMATPTPHAGIAKISFWHSTAGKRGRLATGNAQPETR